MSLGAMCTTTHTNITQCNAPPHGILSIPIKSHYKLYSDELVEFYCKFCYGSCLINKLKDSPGKKDFEFLEA